MRPGVDDGGVLLLQHDGQSWVMVNLSGEAVFRNDAVAVDDTMAACNWAHTIALTVADRPPVKPHNTIPGVHCYTFHDRGGIVHAELSAGRVHHDGAGWVVVDANGEVTERNNDLGLDDEAGALDWANTLLARSGSSKRDRWRLDIGRFPDGTYGDAYGRLGRQRLRRAWNRLVG
jgi:hypothetical protein